VNIGAASMPSAVDLAIRKGLAAGESFEGILDRVQLRDAQRHPDVTKTSSYASGAGAATFASSTKPIRIRS
jgi:hypothetical protein